jgi:peptidoglycan/xylan/chitin deacetylase (PgdA/CDA1 family)
LLTRDWIRSRIRHAWLSLAGSAPRSFGDSFLRCLYLHWVYDDQVEAFRGLLTRLLEHGAFVTSEQLREMACGGSPIDGRYFHLSFDDGFDNVYRNAFPVMEELGIPSTIFVPTRFVGASDEEVLRNWWNGRTCPTRPLDWVHLREMVEAGHEVGAHTRHHVRLSDVSRDPEKLRQELEGSRQDVEAALGRPCRYMSWPYGKWSDIDGTALDAIESAGYEMCFSAVRGRVRPGTTSVTAVPRHHFEPEWPWSHVRYFAAGGKE